MEGRGSLRGGESAGPVAQGLGGLAEGTSLEDTAASATPAPYPLGLGLVLCLAPGMLQHPPGVSLTLSAQASSPNPLV